jgi:hypothetical protein
MKRLLIALGLVLAVAGCKDYGRCLQHDTQLIMLPISSGKGFTMVPIWQDVCTQYEFPEGKENN